MREYLATGKLGFESFKDMPQLTPSEEGRDTFELVASFIQHLGKDESEQTAQRLAQIFNIDVKNKTEDGFVRISPILDGRLKLVS